MSYRIVLVGSILISGFLLRANAFTGHNRLSILRTQPVSCGRRTFESTRICSVSINADHKEVTKRFKSDASRSSGPRVRAIEWFSRISKVFGLVLVAISAFAKRASAETFPLKATLGWDLYGRVPNDDWLFGTNALLDPKLLRRSIVEAVGQELPIAIGNFKRNKRIKEVANIIGSLGYSALFLAFLAIVYRGIMIASVNRVKRGEFSSPLSAISKKAARRGKQLDNMDEGWVDMEFTDDSDSSGNDAADGKGKKKKPSKKTDDDDDDEEN